MFPGSNGRIAFYYRLDDGLYVVNPDGTSFSEIRNDMGRWLGPRWSRDATRLAVGLQAPNLGQDIWVVDATGANPMQLTFTGASAAPSWSPDGTEIAYQCQDVNAPPNTVILEICVVNVESKAVRRITDVADGIYGLETTWSPNGDVIVYSGQYEAQVNGETVGRLDLFAVSPDGGPSTNLTPDDAFESNPDFSPDGEKIVFDVNASDGNSGGIGIVDADGGSTTMVTFDKTDLGPAWSPDGTKIAFSRQDANFKFQLWVLDLNSQDSPIQITDKPDSCMFANWESIKPTRKVKLVFDPNSATIPGLEQFQVPATGFDEVKAIATLTDPDDKPVANEDLVFLPDVTGKPPTVLCSPTGRIWPDHRLDDGTPVPANFTRQTDADGKAKMRVRAGTQPGSWELVARTPDATGGDDLDQTSLDVVGTVGGDVPDTLLTSLRDEILLGTGAKPSTAGDATVSGAAIQSALLEWLTLLKHQGFGGLAAVDFAPIHREQLGPNAAAIVFYPRGADPAPLLAHFASNGASGIPYETRVFDVGLSQLLSGGQDLPTDMPLLEQWELDGAGLAGRLEPHPDETLQFFGYPYPLPLADPSALPRRAVDDTQCGHPDPALLSATVESPVNLLFTDGQGRRFGVDGGGTDFLEIAGGVLSRNANGEPQGYVVPVGSYTVTLSGTGKGKAHVTFLTPGASASTLNVFELKAKDGATGTLQVTDGAPAGTLDFAGKTYGAQPYGFTKSATRCAAGKKKCVAKKADGLLKCYAKGAKRGSLDEGCLAKVRAKFEGGKSCFAKLEAKGGCLTTGDTDAIQRTTDDHAAAVVAALDPASPGTTKNACIAGKLKCVGKYTKALFACHQAAEKAGALDAGCIAGARARFDGGSNAAGSCFAKLEAKGGCATTGDTVALETTVRSGVNNVVCALDPVRQLAPCE